MKMLLEGSQNMFKWRGDRYLQGRCLDERREKPVSRQPKRNENRKEAEEQSRQLQP